MANVDIVERLRERAFDWCDAAQEAIDGGSTGGYELSTAGLINEAVEEIERLRVATAREDSGAGEAGLRAALEEITQLAWEGADIDGGDFHELMVRRGLFVEVPASEEFKDEWDCDTMFVLSWKDSRSALQETPDGS